MKRVLRRAACAGLCLLVSAAWAFGQAEGRRGPVHAEPLADVHQHTPDVPLADYAPETDSGWDFAFSLQAGVYANHWGKDGGVKAQDFGDGEVWENYNGGGNFTDGLNVDDTGFQLYQAWFGVGRTWGHVEELHLTFHGDVMYGANARFFQCVNRFDAMLGSDGRYGLAIPELSLSLGYGDFHVKFGKFITPYGNDGDGFFFSDSYSFLPDTHMGVLGTWDVSENFSLLAGWTQGWGEAFDSDSESSLIWAGFSRRLTDKVLIGYTMSVGSMEGHDDAYAHSILFEWAPVENLVYTLEYQFGTFEDAYDAQEPDAGTLHGVIQTLVYTLTDNLDAGLRFDYQRQKCDGETTDLYGTTLALHWAPFREARCFPCRCPSETREFCIRPEIRYDSRDGAGKCAFNGGQNTYQFSGGISLDYTF